MKKAGFILFLLMLACSVRAQKLNDARQAVSDLLEPLAEKQLIPEDYSELFNDLLYLYENPLNINTATKEDLERIPFLDDFQIENILFYVYNNGPLLTIYELNAVKGLTPETIRQIVPFLKVEPPGREKKSARAGVEMIARGQTVVQTPSGYKMRNDALPAAFSGSRERIFSRIRAHFGERLFAGFTMEKDPGEPAFGSEIPLMDFLSGYVMFKPKGIFKKIIIGDYKASFSQGLGLWSGLAFTKSSNVIDVRRRAKGIERYSSVNETSYLRGAAVQMKIQDFNFHLFGSYKKIDGTLSGAGITTIRDDGYHRTGTEIGYRHNLSETFLGGVASWQSKSLKIDVGQTYWHIDKPLITGDQPYKLPSFTGDSLFSTFAGYSWFGRKVILFGEAALQNFRNFAAYQGLTFSPGAGIRLTLSYRNYSRHYFAVKTNPFAESSAMNGESGVYTAVSFRPFKRLTINSYFDVFRYNWLKYRTDAPSAGHELLINGDYSPLSGMLVSLRFRNLTKQRNKLFYEGNGFPVTDQTLNSVRLQVNYPVGETWWFRSRIEQSFFREEEGHSSNGFLIYIDVKHSFAKNRFSAEMRLTHFDTDDYYSRIYTWEPDVLYAFSIPAFTGRGLRFLFNMAYRPTSKIQFWFRLGNTFMPNVEKIGSGYNAVTGKNLTGIKFQARIRL